MSDIRLPEIQFRAIFLIVTSNPQRLEHEDQKLKSTNSVSLLFHN